MLKFYKTSILRTKVLLQFAWGQNQNRKGIEVKKTFNHISSLDLIVSGAVLFYKTRKLETQLSIYYMAKK